MAPIIYNLNDATFRSKMIGLDYDWTLVNPKGGQTFPKNIDDWTWYSPTVPDKLKQYYDDGYMLVVFTNQSKSWKDEQIKLVMSTLNIPVFVVVNRDKCDYKPNIISYNTLFTDNEIDKTSSFFIGDALGRKTDFADSDKVFAENIGIPYLSPEQVFLTKSFEEYDVSHIQIHVPTIIIMMGYPGSGKTSFANNICNDTDKLLAHIKGDDYKSNTPKMLKASLAHIQTKSSIIFDATNSSIKKRKLYIDHANKHDYAVVCIHMSLALDVSYKRSNMRQEEKTVPKIAFSVYKKYYEEPTEAEGFILHTV